MNPLLKTTFWVKYLSFLAVELLPYVALSNPPRKEAALSNSSSEKDTKHRRVHWTKQEDEQLITTMKVVKTHNPSDFWGTVAAFSLLNRSARQCKDRYCDHLDPKVNKGPLTPEEKERIAQLRGRDKLTWAVIAEQLPGRTALYIKNYWNGLCRRTRQQVEEQNSENTQQNALTKNNDLYHPKYQENQQFSKSFIRNPSENSSEESFWEKDYLSEETYFI
ncbi:MAG: hypothetical protein LBB11_00210 [Puniceicoccales bacterium]|jgi:hypothetical protein|nr:hypothetical protein [Puniceicoccales bacterium]